MSEYYYADCRCVGALVCKNYEPKPNNYVGSAEWAWEQMEKGKCAYIGDLAVGYWHIINGLLKYNRNGIDENPLNGTCNKIDWINSVIETGWQIYTPAKFADVKKDDYVLFNNNIILQVIGVSDDTFIVPHPSVHEFANFNKSDGRHTYGSEYHALRKFPASEVQIEIKLKPMRISNGYSNERLKIINELDIIDFIDKSAIQNIDEVEALLAQQEKEKK